MPGHGFSVFWGSLGGKWIHLVSSIPPDGELWLIRTAVLPVVWSRSYREIPERRTGQSEPLCPFHFQGRHGREVDSKANHHFHETCGLVSLSHISDCCRSREHQFCNGQSQTSYQRNCIKNTRCNKWGNLPRNLRIVFQNCPKFEFSLVLAELSFWPHNGIQLRLFFFVCFLKKKIVKKCFQITWRHASNSLVWNASCHSDIARQDSMMAVHETTRETMCMVAHCYHSKTSWRCFLNLKRKENKAYGCDKKIKKKKRTKIKKIIRKTNWAKILKIIVNDLFSPGIPLNNGELQHVTWLQTPGILAWEWLCNLLHVFWLYNLIPVRSVLYNLKSPFHGVWGGLAKCAPPSSPQRW